MGKSTISMAIFNSYVKLPEGILVEYTDLDYFDAKKKPFHATLCHMLGGRIPITFCYYWMVKRRLNACTVRFGCAMMNRYF